MGAETPKTKLNDGSAGADLAVGRADERKRAKALRSAAVLLWRRVSACSVKSPSGDFLPKHQRDETPRNAASLCVSFE